MTRRRFDMTDVEWTIYALGVRLKLFSEISPVRAWGQIETRGRQIGHLFDNESQAITLFLDLLRDKRKRGYLPKPPVDIQWK